jgi:uncharacterized RDD family membrane protein YckC
MNTNNYDFRESVIKIKTPEGIVFPIKMAGPVARFFAWAIDMGCILVINTVMFKFIALFQLFSQDIVMAARLFTYFIVSTLYFIASEWFMGGQSPGKKRMNLRVMDADGYKLAFSQIVLRNLMRAIDSLPLLYGLGGTLILFSAKGQRAGDFMAGTIVAWTPKLPKPDLSSLASGKFNSFNHYPHIIAKLRQKVSHAEAEIALQAVLRRDQFNADARLDLFKTMALQFKEKAGFPEVATEGLSDEQYIKNIVDVLFN